MGLPAQIRQVPHLLYRFFLSVSIFGIFYYILWLLSFRWNEYLGPTYAGYAAIFQLDWQALTTGALIFIMVAVADALVTKNDTMVRETAFVLSLWGVLAAVLGAFMLVLVLSLVYAWTGSVFPWSLTQILFVGPVIVIAATTETMVWQWFLARAANIHWKYGFVIAQVAFATAHANLSLASFMSLLLLGVVFYYLTNPSGNLPFFVNLVFAAGVHSVYNVFAFAYGTSTGFVTDYTFQGLTIPSFLFWGMVGGILALVVAGELRSRRGVGA